MVAVLACLSLLATLTCLGALVRVHLLPTGYRPLRNAVSDYGVGAYPWLLPRADGGDRGRSGLPESGSRSRSRSRTPGVIVFLVVFALARLARLLQAPTEPFFGLIERCFYAAMITWFVVVSIHLI